MRVLVIEDEPGVASFLKKGLREASYAVDLADNGIDGLPMAVTATYDAIVLDLMLPGIDGFSILRDVRSRDIRTPVICLTARDAVDDRIKGLDLGADDYLTKPFEMGEFDARVRALLRRSRARGLAALSCGPLTLDIAARRAFLNDRPLDLPRREFHLLEVLMSRQGRIISKDQIIDSISDFHDEMNPSTVEIYIHRIRKKLEATDVTIRTVRGVGYILE